MDVHSDFTLSGCGDASVSSNGHSKSSVLLRKGLPTRQECTILAVINSEEYFPALQSLTLHTLLGISRFVDDEVSHTADEGFNPIEDLRKHDVHRILDPSLGNQHSLAAGR